MTRGHAAVTKQPLPAKLLGDDEIDDHLEHLSDGPGTDAGDEKRIADEIGKPGHDSAPSRKDMDSIPCFPAEKQTKPQFFRI